MPIRKWNADKVVQHHGGNDSPLMQRMKRAGFHLERVIKQSFGASSASTLAGRGGAAASKAEREAGRSEPGEPPHVQTGRLRASITTNWTGSGQGRAEVKNPVSDSKADDGVSEPDERLQVRVGTNVEYGIHLELGMKNMSPRPFLRSAWDTEQATLKAIIAGK